MAQLRGENCTGRAPHLRVVSRARSALPRSLSGSAPAPGRLPTPKRPRFQTLAVETVPGTRRRCAPDRSPIPGREAEVRPASPPAPYLSGLAVPPGQADRWLGLARRWARSPGNGVGYNAPQRPNRAASRRAGTQARAGLTQTPGSPFSIPSQHSSSKHTFLCPQITACLLNLACPVSVPLQVSPSPSLLETLSQPAHFNESMCWALDVP